MRQRIVLDVWHQRFPGNLVIPCVVALLVYAPFGLQAGGIEWSLAAAIISLAAGIAILLGLRLYPEFIEFEEEALRIHRPSGWPRRYNAYIPYHSITRISLNTAREVTVTFAAPSMFGNRTGTRRERFNVTGAPSVIAELERHVERTAIAETTM